MRAGRRPRSPSASRSNSVNAVPLLSVGSCSSATPLAEPSGVENWTWLVIVSTLLGNHLDRAAGALGHADAAALAVVVVELEPLAGPELDHCVVGTHAVA